MSLAKRIIPCLDVDQGRVVKGVNFVGIRDAGDPIEIARRYNDAGADEITFLDITASHEQRDTTYRTVEQIASRDAVFGFDCSIACLYLSVDRLYDATPPVKRQSPWPIEEPRY